MHLNTNSTGFEISLVNTIKLCSSRPGWLKCIVRNSLLAVILSATGFTLATAAQLQMPSLVDPASHNYHVGKVIFVELVTPDMDVAKKFYGGLFGWSFKDSQHSDIRYAQASLDGRPVAGLVYKPLQSDKKRQPAWLTFISVRDVDAANTAAQKQGAKVLFKPHDVPNRGRQAVFADPQGAVFAVLASSSGDPEDTLPQVGEWIWSSLITNDADTSAAFYQTLFNYDVFEMGAKKDGEHLLLASDNFARASVNSKPEIKTVSAAKVTEVTEAIGTNFNPHWLNYVRVDDTEKMVKKVVALGGSVLIPPRVDRHGGKVAVVADPGGAPFGLLEWTNTNSKEVNK